MSKGSGGKPASGTPPERPNADTPNRLVIRSGEGGNESMAGGDTAVAVAVARSGELSDSPATTATPVAGTPALADLVGATLSGRYVITRKVGQGGMGVVYEATHTTINRKFAVKVLLEKYAQREAIVRRLKQEAQLASSVNNEHIIEVVDFGTTDDGRTFVVMEFLEGESLAECLARESQLPEQRILRIVAQAASALAAAHDKGIVHRDIKPENLFLIRRKDNDFVKVVDFGISKSLRASDEQEETTRLTQTGMVLGTPLYMSPEQARGNDELDHRVDIYALGVILYEAATGRVPFAGNNYLSVISQVLNETPTPIRTLRPEISEEYEAIVSKAMARDVEDRYPSALALLSDLNALLEDPTHSTERARITGLRRRLPKKGSGSRTIVWVAGLAVVLAGIVYSVTTLVGSAPTSAAAGSGSALAVALPVVDAAAAATGSDAPPVPETEVVEVRFESVPPGAVVFLDGIEKGTTPFTIKVVKKDRDVKGVAQLASHNDQPLQFNPLELPEDKTVRFKLVKPPKGSPIQHRPIKDKPAGPTVPVKNDKTGGDLGGDPYGTGGTLRSK